MILKISFRNLWRNKRRTLITISSVFFGLLVAILMRSVQLGTYDNMLQTLVEKNYGEIQIRPKYYLADVSYNKPFIFSKKIKNSLNSNNQIIAFAPRLFTYSWIIANGKSDLGTLYGIDFQKEINFLNINNSLVKYHITQQIANTIIKDTLKAKKICGYYRNRSEIKEKFINCGLDTSLIIKVLEKAKIKYFLLSENTSDRVYIGYLLAEKLGVKAGDKILIYTKSINSKTLTKSFFISGIVKLSDNQLNKSAIFLSIKQVSKFLTSQDSVLYASFIVIDTKFKATLEFVEYKNIKKIVNKLNKNLPKNLIALGWKDSNKELTQQIQSDNISGQIMVFVLYFVIAFGIFGTVLMMFNERIKEFAILFAIGTKKIKLILSFVTEMFFIALFGILSGEIFGFLIINFIHKNPIKLKGDISEIYQTFNIEPIITTKTHGLFLYKQALFILIMVLIVMLYPIFKLMNFKFSKAIKR